MNRCTLALTAALLITPMLLAGCDPETESPYPSPSPGATTYSPDDAGLKICREWSTRSVVEQPLIKSEAEAAAMKLAVADSKVPGLSLAEFAFIEAWLTAPDAPSGDPFGNALDQVHRECGKHGFPIR